MPKEEVEEVNNLLKNFCKFLMDFEKTTDTAICDYGMPVEYFVEKFLEESEK